MGSLRSACQACAPSSSALPAGPCLSQHATAQKGLNLRQRGLIIARFTWVRWKGTAVAGRGAGRGGKEEAELPEEGLSAVSSHSPPPHKPSI